jgi:hypothetical protein
VQRTLRRLQAAQARETFDWLFAMLIVHFEDLMSQRRLSRVDWGVKMFWSERGHVVLPWTRANFWLEDPRRHKRGFSRRKSPCVLMYGTYQVQVIICRFVMLSQQLCWAEDLGVKRPTRRSCLNQLGLDGRPLVARLNL